MRDLLRICEEDVRAGRGHMAAKRISHLNIAKIPRLYRLAFANIARRTGLFSFGLRLLTPIVRLHKSGARGAASPAELAEYAMLLMRIGAVAEGLELLKDLPATTVPEVNLYRAIGHMNRWESEQAVLELSNYLDANLNTYQKLLGQVNLAAALITSEFFNEAQNLLDEAIDTARREKSYRLLGNCLELRAQTFIHTEKFEAAQADLVSAEDLIGEQRTADQLFVRKWKTILQGLMSNDPDPIHSFQMEAIKRQHWESVRECDLYLLKIRFEQARFHHLVAGTPFPSYRSRIVRTLNRKIELDHYMYGFADAPCLDLASGRIGHRAQVSFGKQTHHLLTILLKDLYRPLRLGGLFSELFVTEHFDIHSSPARVRQSLYRARRHIQAAQIPLSILHYQLNYRVEVHQGLSIRLPFEYVNLDRDQETLTKLMDWSHSQSRIEFTARQARQALDLPLTTFQRFATWAVSKGRLFRLGSGRHTRYRIGNVQSQPLRAKQAA